MKKFNLLALSIVFTVATVSAQQEIPNGDFNGWNGNIPNSWTPAGGAVKKLVPFQVSISGNNEMVNTYSGAGTLQMDNSSGTGGLATVSTKFAYTKRPNTMHFVCLYFPQNTSERFGISVNMTKTNGAMKDTILSSVIFFPNLSTIYPWRFLQVDLNQFYRDWAGTVGSNDSMPDTCQIVILNSVISPTANTRLIFDDLNFSSNKLSVPYMVGSVPARLNNYPNPVNGITTITYRLYEAADVTLDVFDITGKKVANLVNEYQTAEDHKIDFDASALKPGIYFYKIKAGQAEETKKMIVTQ